MDPKELKRVRMVKRIAQEFPNGALVNLGIGMPTMVANYIPADRTILLHSENGYIGLGPQAEKGKEDQRLVNAGGQAVTIVPGGCFFDSAMSFAIIRGGHVDYTVLGALEVDEQGDLANWMIPGKMVPGMGGAMDLVTGAKRVVVAMQHTAKGKSKIVAQCTLPLTSSRPVDLVVTELAVIAVPEGRATLMETAPGVSVDDVRASTEAELAVAASVATMAL